MLFYYFHDKKTLYLFLFEYAANSIKEDVTDAHLGEITDFFELCAYASERKCQMLQRSPFIMDFIMRAFYSQQEAVSEDINKRVEDETSKIFATYFSGIDFSRFRDGINPKDIYQMLTWLSDGYIHEKQRTGQPISLEETMEKFSLWSYYFKKMSYKEEFQS